MDPALKTLIARARVEHDCAPGATIDEIAALEGRLGHALTDELRELLGACNGIRFWASGNFPCRLLSVEEIKPVHLWLGGDEGPPGLVALIESQGDFVAIGLDRETKCFSQLVDCSHETFPHELFKVCDSLQDLLALILDSQDGEWIWPAVRAGDTDLAE